MLNNTIEAHALSKEIIKPLPDVTKSLAMLAEARKIMHPVSQTLAKAPGQFSEGICPVYVESASGNRIVDIDGNSYLDYYSAIGPISLGYAYKEVDDAIIAQLQKGITFSLMHRLEFEFCVKISTIIPNAESVRISKTGADVCSAAVRIARAYTKRNKILCCGYHGWHEWYIATTTRNEGIPTQVASLTATFKYNDLNDIKSKLDDDVAAVILEPFIFDAPQTDYLKELKQLCQENGSLLIFDEMWTGFRIALGGAQEYFNVQPDLAVYSKAISNGMPLAILTGRKDIMQNFDQDVFFFTTFGGEALSIAAAMATINVMEKSDYFKRLNELGTMLKDGINDLIEDCDLEKYMVCQGYPSRTILNLTQHVAQPLHLYAYIQQELLRHGILWSKFHNMTYSFNEVDIALTLGAYSNIFNGLKAIIVNDQYGNLLHGKPLDAVFRKTKF